MTDVVYDVVPRAGVIDLGKQVEGLVTRVVLPNIRRGAGAVQLVHQRSDDQKPYLVPVTEDGDKVYWIVSRSDTAFPGRGQAELQWLGENGEVAKSVTYQTNTTRSMAEPGPEPDEPLRPYTQAVAKDAQAAKNAAASATEAARSAEASAGQAGLSADNAAKALKKLEDGIASGDFRGQDGKSAYQLAVDAGFDGTETQWLESLKGAPGDTTAADAAAEEAKKAAQEAQKAAEASAGSAAQAAESVSGLADDLATLKTENTALKTETARTARSLDYLWKKSKGIIYDTETVTGAGSSVTVPSGAMDYAALRKLGGMSQRDEENNVLIDATVDEVRVSNAAGDSTNAYQIPQTIRDMCPDYGIGVSEDCYNYIDFAAKQYHHIVGGYVFDGSERYLYHEKIGTCSRNVIQIDIKRKPGIGKTLFSTYNFYYDFSADVKHYYVGKTDDPQSGMAELYVFDTFATLAECRTALIGAKLYFELATPETIDLSAVWPDDFGVLRVEAGGTINLHYPALDDGYELAVPSETEIMVDVAKVVGTDG